ncbi:ElyC/SanA/YdcF family protein [Curtobacterium luteum]|uniref:ElyC/SanA/YdcF family protein n=1 Tax=Curtobacterium luteum TaxID=33881 RepID=UPI0037F13A95
MSLVNRWRARVALRSVRGRPAARIICSGGAVRGTTAEGDLLARYLRRGLGWSGPIEVERRSRSTWENVANIVPALGDAEWLLFASGSLHAEKARAYLRRQRPDLVHLMVPGADHRWGEMAVGKPLFAAVGLWKLARLRCST